MTTLAVKMPGSVGPSVSLDDGTNFYSLTSNNNGGIGFSFQVPGAPNGTSSPLLTATMTEA